MASDDDKPDMNMLPPADSIRNFMIPENDLAELERIVPDIMHRHIEICGATKTRVQLEKVKRILSNVRWKYAPSIEGGKVPFNPEGEQP